MAQSALPKGGTVVSGSAAIGNPSANALTITQTTPKAIINWNSFSVGQPNTVTINQPNPSSASLNRVTGSTPSSIAGSLSSNGSVLLVNPNGVAITPTGTVKVGGGFVGSTLDIKNTDFEAGKLNFSAPGTPADVSNAGTISAGSGGSVALLGGRVSNAGIISVPLGKVGLGSAQQATLDPSGNGFLQVTVPSGATTLDGRPLIDVAGSIKAPGGRVEISAATAQQAVRNAVHISGNLSATSVSGHSGSITLDGGAGGNVAVSGAVTTAGGTAAPGGTIVATGHSVNLAPTAKLNASGTSGGTILVGGDRKGGSVASAKLVASPVRNAQATNIAPGASIVANGTTGAGGNIVVWSDVNTNFQGALSATGAGTATGGTAEVSSHGVLGYLGTVDLSSPGGIGGTLTLDPYNLTVTGSATTATQSPAGTYTSGSGTSNVLNTDIQNLLNAGTSVVLATGTGSAGNGDITVSAAIAKTAGTAASLTLDASGSITVGAAISSTSGAMAVTLDSNIAGNGGFITVNAPITTNGGNLILGGGATPLTGAAVGTAGGNGDGNFPHAGVLISSNLSAGGGNITINGTGYAAGTNNAIGVGLNVSDNVSVTTTGSGNISMTGTGGGSTFNNDGLVLFESTITTGTGNIFLKGTGGPNATDGGGNNTPGVAIVQAGGAISTGGSGTITIQGAISNSGSGGGSEAVVLGTNTISAVNGLISITGTNTATATASAANAYPNGINYPGVLFSGTTVTSTGTGGITINGTGGGTGAGGFNPGVMLTAAGSVKSTSTGAISITGTGGGGSSDTGGSNYGVAWSNATAIQATGTGTITVNGTGGGAGGSGTGNSGIYVGAALAGGGGTLSLTGTGGGSSGNGNFGINVANVISNTGTGAIILNGTGAGTSFSEFGVYETANITAVTGAVSVTGTAGASATGNGDHGVAIVGSTVSTTGTGTITIQGTGTGSGTSSGTYGVILTGGGIVTAVNGLVSVTGTNNSTGTGGTNYGVYVTGASSTIQSTGTGGVNVTGTGGGSGASGSNYGVFWDVASGIQSTATGPISLTGTGGDAGGTGTANNGVYTAQALSGGGGKISITGTPSTSSGGSTYGISLASVAAGAGVIQMTSTGAVTTGGAVTTTAGLELGGAGGTYTLTTAGNSVVNLAGNTGSVTYTQSASFAIGTVSGVTGLTASGTVALSTTGTVSQTAAISAAGLEMGGTNPTYTLTNSGNTVTTLAGSTGSGAISFTGSGGFAIGTVAGVAGLTTTGTLALSATGAVTQTAAISATGLELGGVGGAYTLTTSGNSITTLAGNTASLSYTQTSGLTIGTVAGVAGLTATGSVALSSTGTVNQTALVSAAGLELGGVGGAYTLTNASNAVTTLAGNTASVTYTQTSALAIGTVAGVAGLTTTGAMAITATAAGAGTGLTLSGTTVSGGGASTLSGTSSTGTGILFGGTGSITATGGGSVTLTGTGSTSANAISLPTGTTLTTSGTVSMTGTSSSGTGILLAGTVTVTDSTGTTSMNGTSSSGNGVQLGNGTGTDGFTFNGPAANQLLLKGTATSSSAGYGLYINQIATIGTTGIVELEGIATHAAAYGIYWAPTTGSNSLTVTSGSLTMQGVNQSSGTAADITSSVSLTNNGSGGFTLDGTSNSSLGLNLPAGTITVSNNSTGTFTLSGNKDTADVAAPTGTGLELTGALTINAGPVTLTASGSGANSGLWLQSGVVINNNGTGLLTLASTNLMTFSTKLTSTAGGDVAISETGGTVSQAAGSFIDAGNVKLSGTGAYTLTQSNAFSTIAGSVGSLSLNNAEALTIGTVQGTSGLSSTGSLVLDVTSGNLTIAAGATVTGSSPLLVTPAAFINNQGSNAVTASSGSWQIFSANPAGDTFNSLNSGNSAIWTTSYSGSANAASGDRYIFSLQPTVTFTPVSTSKTYGVSATAAVASSYTVSGIQTTVANAFIGDTAATAYSGTPSVTSTGSGVTAAAGSYSITATVGTLSALGSYQLAYGSAATLTVNAAALAVTANALSKTYGAANPTLTYTATGLVNSDTLSGALATAATVTSGIGTYAITQGTLSASANYTLTYTAANLTINTAPLTITATAQSRAYGATNPTLTYSNTALLNGDTLSGALSTTALVTSGVGSYPISQGSLTAGANYAITYNSANLTVSQAALTVTANAISQTYGTAIPTLTYSSAGLVNGDSLSGALSTAATITSNVGSYAITQGSLTASSNYAITYNSANLVITTAPLAVTANAVSQAYGTAIPTFTYTATGLLNGNTLSGALATSATVSSGVGTYAITQGTLAASSNYSLTYTPANLSITTAALTVTATALTRAYGAANPSLTYTATGLVNGNTLSGSLAVAATVTSNIGTYPITQGSLAASSNYVLTYNSANLTVTTAPLTVTATAQSRTYGAANPTLTYTTSGLLNSDTVSGALATAATVTSGVGSYAITQGSLVATSNYALTYAQANLTVTTAAVSVAANALSKVYGAANPTLTYSVTGLLNSDTLSGSLSTTASLTSGVGTYPISQGSLAATSNYSLTYTAANVTVTAAPLSVTANALSRAYGAANPTLTYTATGLANGDTLTGAQTTTATVSSGVGTYPISQGSLAATANYTLTYTGANLTVSTAPLSVTANAVSQAYGTSIPTLTYTATGLVNSDTLSGALSTTATSTAGIGTYPISQGSLAASSNYVLTYNSANFTITTAPLTVTANAVSQAYGVAIPTLTYTATGLANGDTLSGALSTTATSTSSVGTYPISQGTLLATSNYALSYTAANFTVTQAALAVTANALTRAYGAANPTLTYSATGLVNGNTLSGALSTTAVVTSGVGTYPVAQGTLTAGSNYAITYTPANLTVSTAALAVTANAVSQAYGTAIPTLTYGTTGLVNGDSLSGALSTTALVTSGIGTYPISQGTLAASANYTLTYAGANFTITTAALTVTANALTRAYGAANPTLTYTATGLVNGDPLTGAQSTTAVLTSAIGTYPISKGSLAASANYSLTYNGANLAVSAAPLTVTANAVSQAYGTAIPTFTYTATGLVNSDSLTGALTTAATSSSGVGAYAITQGTLAATSNYSLTYTPANLTITTAALTVTANALTRAYGAANPTLTYSTSGLVNGDSLTGALTTAATVTSGVGSYAITQGSLAATANYSLTYTPANLTVTAAALSVTANALSRAYGAANPTLTYTSTGLVNGDSLSGALATTAISTSAIGTYPISQGSLAASANYTLTFTPANLTVTSAQVTVTADALSRTYGAANPTLTYTTTGLTNGDTLSGALATTATVTSGVGSYAITQGTLTSANYTLSYNAANLTVTTAPLSVAATAQSRAYGAANPSLTYTATGLLNSDTLSGALATTAVATSGVGTYPITQGSLANANYAITYTPANLTLTTAALTVTANALSKTYGAANPSLTYTTAGLVNGDTLSGAVTTAATTTSAVGTYAISQGTLAASANYSLTYTPANLTVTQAPLSLTATAQSRAYGAANPSLTYTTSGLLFADTLSGALATSAVATSGVGTYPISQGSLANANYAITYNAANLTVTTAALTVGANALTRTYGAANPSLTYTTAGLVNADTLSGALTTTAGLTSNVGSYAITQGNLAASANYSLTYTPANLTVTQAALSVTANALSRNYGAANPSLTYTTSGLLNSDTLSGALTTAATVTSGIGTYPIAQGSLANSNYAITYTAANLTVTTAPLTVTANAISQAYGTAIPTLTYSSTGLVNGDSLSGTLSTPATVTSNVGTYAINQGSLAATANYSLTYNSANLTITQAALTVTANALTRVYGAANPALTYTSTGLVNGDSLSGALTTAATLTSAVGSYAITQGSLAATANYSLTYNSANLTVTPAALTVTADAQTRAYGVANPTFTYSETGLVNGDTLSGALATLANVTSGIGTYAINQGTVAASANYTLSYTQANLSITTAPLTVTADALTRAYGSANPALSYTSTGLVNGDSLSGALTTAATLTSNIGTYPISQGSLAATSNYSVAYIGANLTVTTAPLTVTATALSRVYGTANPTFTYSSSGLLNGDALTGALGTSAGATSAVGSYAINQGSLAASSNYALSYVGANLTITSAPLTVAADALSRAYGAANPTLTYTTSGLVNGDTLSGALATTAVATSNIGTYGITQGTLSNANYAISYTPANLTVTAAPLTVAADALSRAYGAANPTLTYGESGLVNGDTLTGALATAAVATSVVGTYAITQGTLAASSNYALAYTPANLTISALALTVTANALTRVYGAANPALTYTTSGLVNGDSLTGALATAAVATSSVGSYAISQGSLAAPASYAVSYVGANLTITQAPLTVVADALSRAYGAANPTFTYTATGLVNADTLTGALATTAVATSGIGTYGITQGTLNNTNYNISYTAANLTVTTAALTVTATTLTRAYGAANPGLTYTTSGIVNGDTLTGALATTATVTSGVGTYGITQGTLAASANYALSYIPANLTVTALNLTVTADAISRAYGAANPTLTYSAAGLVNGDSLAGALATSATTTSGVGAYAITQGSLANANYNLLFTGANLTVTPASLTVTANALSRSYGAGNPSLTYTTAGLVNGDSLTGALATSATTTSAVGTYAITQGSLANPNYTLTYVPANLSVGQATLTVVADTLTRVYGAANPTLTYTANGLVNGDTLSGGLATTAVVTSNVGAYPITVGSLAATANYNLNFTGANLTVTAAALTVTANALSQTYGAATPALTYTSAGLVNGDSLSGALATTATTTSSVGTYPITQGTLSASPNYTLTYTPADLTITQAPLTVTANAISSAYGATTPPTLTYTATGLVGSDTLTGALATGATITSSVGTYPITVGTLANPNYSIAYTGANLTVTPAALTVTANAIGKTFGADNPALTYATTGLVNGDTVSGALATTAVTGSAVGSYPITQGTITASANYALTFNAATLTVTAATLTITADALSRAYGVANPALTYSAVGLIGGDTLSGALATTATLTSGVGSYAITQGSLNNTNYTISYTGANLTVTPAGLAVTADALSRTYGAGNPTLTYQTNGLVNGDTLIGTLATAATATSAVGSYAITMGSLVNPNYSITYTGANLTVTAAPLSVAADTLTRVYGAANPTLTYTAAGLLNGDTFSGALATTASATSSIGSYAITQGSLTAGANYAIAYTAANLSVTAAPLTVTADTLSKVYGAANPTLTYTSTGLVNGDSLTGALTTAASVTSGVGSYAITQGSLAATTNYTLTYTGATLSVTQAPLTVAADALSRAYGAGNPTLTYTAAGLLNGDSLTGAQATVASGTSAVGVYAITQGTLNNPNYLIGYTGANLTVTQAALTVTANALSRVYGGANPSLTYATTGLVNGDSLTGALTTSASVTSDVGNYAITQGSLAATANYSLTYTAANLTITPAGLTVAADTLSRVYGATNPSLTYTTSGLVNGDGLTGALATSAGVTSGIGAYAITQGTLAATSNYSLTYSGANLTITTAPLTVTANAQSRTYGAGNPTLSYTASGLLNGDVLGGALATGAAATSSVGTYAITQGTLANANYAVTYTGANLTVTQAALAVMANSLTRAYGAANPTLTYATNGLVNGDTLTGSLATSAVAASSIGTYAINQGTLAVSPNYALTYTGANLTVTAAALTVTANALSRAYGATNPTLTYTTTGLVNGDVLSGALATSASATSSVGSYGITQGTLANGNYALSYTAANLTVTPAALAVSAAALSRTYGTANPTLTYTATGLVNGDVLSGALATTASATSNVGAYAITQGTLANSNYSFTYTGANLTVTTAALTVTANALSRAYGAANPTLAYSTSGLVNGDTVAGALATAATATSNVGTYAITQGSLAASSNYSLTYSGANLIVTTAALTVTANALSRVYGAANPALSYSTAGLVNGDSVSGALATSALATSGVGSYFITQGSIAASSNYLLTYTGANLTVTPAALAVTANPLSRVYGAANPTLTYSTTGLVNGDSVFGALATAASATSNVGAYAITQGTLAATANYALTYTGANLSVTAAPLSVTADALSRAYGAANPTFTYTASGLLNGDGLAGALATAASATTGIGTYAITQGTLGNTNYSIAYTGANLTVTAAALTVTADALSRAYGAANPTLTYTTTGLVNGDSLTGVQTTAASATSGVGSYAITQGSLAASANYSLTYTGGNLTITAAALSVTADALSRAYGAANPTLTYSTTGLVNGDSVTGGLATAASATSNVGAYAITQGTLAASANYSLTYTAANLTITPAALSVTADALSRSYGAANPTLTYSTAGLVNGDSLGGALATAASATSSVGSYAIAQGSLAASSNYLLSYTGANLTVTPAALSVTADAQSRTYGAANPTLTYSTAGLVNGDALSGGLATAASVTSSIGAYAITQGSLANANYAITYSGATLTITPAALSVTANALSRAYGAANPTFTYATTGLVNGDSVGGALATAAQATSNVGSYAITQGTLAASSNYALTYTAANLTITPAALSVTADALSRSYGAANPTLTYSTAGLVNGDSLSGGLATAASATSSVGSYAIAQGSLAASSNYLLSYTGANLTITPAALSVTADALSRTYGAANPALTYTAAGLLNGDSLAGTLATAASATANVGAYAITQGSLANANYAISYTGSNLLVTPAALAVVANALTRTYGAANPTLTYSATGLLNGDTLAGALATAASATSNVGSYAITQGSLANANYAISYTGANLLVTPAALTVTANGLSRSYGAANPTLTYSETGLVNGDGFTGALATAASASTGVGIYAITQGTLAASSNYALTYGGAYLNVTPAALTITANALRRAYGADNPALTYTTTGLVNGDGVYGSLATTPTATSNAGAYAITRGSLFATPNYALTYVGANLTVTPAPLTVTANAASRTYGADDPALTYSIAGLVNGDTVTGALTTSAFINANVGLYAITQGSLAASANYALQYIGASLLVTPQGLTVSANTLSRSYGAANPTLTYRTTGLVFGDSLSGALATAAAATSNVGSYAITQGSLTASSNYALTSFTAGSLLVTPAALTVAATGLTRPYGAANPALTDTATGLVNGDSVTGGLATAAVATSNIGSYAITQGSLAASANYLLTYTPATLTVSPAALTIAANALSRAYGAANPSLTYTATGLVNGDSVSGGLATSAVATSNIGSYAITQGSLAASANYSLTYIGASLTITPAALTVTADALLRSFGAANPPLTYTANGLVNGDTLTGALATAALVSSPAGNYPITQGNVAASPNYALRYLGANLTVTSPLLAVTTVALPTLTAGTVNRVGGITNAAAVTTIPTAAGGVASRGFLSAVAGGNVVPSVTDGNNVTNPVVSDDVLTKMTRTSWGNTAVGNATAVGVNPYAVAATCVLASDCAAAQGGSATQDVFEMYPASFQQGLQTALAADPSLASQIVQGVDGMSDPTTEAIAASGYLIQAARTLQNAGIAEPTILQARGYFLFGPADGVRLANATPDTPMSSAMPDMSAAALAANGVVPGETVAQWEAFVTGRIGTAATQSLLK